MFNQCLLRLAVLASIGKSATSSSLSMLHSASTTGTNSHRNTALALTESQTPSYPEEITCMGQFYAGSVDLSYTYSLETDAGTDPYEVISNVQGQILVRLAETILGCGKDEVDAADADLPFSKDQLGIIGINSLPEDRPSQLSHCVSMNDDCTIVHGSLTLFLQDGADLPIVRYAARYVINQIMQNDLLVSSVNNLITAAYNGPQIVAPESPTTIPNAEITGSGGSQSSPTSSSGLSAMNKVIVSTLCSALVGIVAAFVLFKKVFNANQNCFAACDGTGLDRDYIENAHFQSPHGKGSDFDGFHGVDEMETVQYDIANGLSVINEDDYMSTAGSYSMSAMTHNSSRMNASDASVAWSDARSVASAKTVTISNKHRTPVFGIEIDALHII